MMGLRPITPTAGLRPPVPVTAHNVDNVMMFNQQKSRALGLDDPFANQLDNGEQNSANSELQEAAAEGKKAFSIFLSSYHTVHALAFHPSLDMLLFGGLILVMLF